jgi:hypothetical protein
MVKSNDAEFIKRLAEKTQNVKKDKEGLTSAATNFNTKYAKEVEEGTRKKQMLLENGRRLGRTDDEILGGMAVFIPSKQTPILNLLHFLRYEYKDVSSDIQVLREEKDSGKGYEQLESELNAQYGHLNFEELKQDIPNILEFIYENVTTEIFNKVKKLKALSKSPNKSEAFAAYTKCNELCDKYKLDFDKIRCEVE